MSAVDMSAANVSPIDERVVPAFARGVRLRLDPAREAWVVLAPERLYLPDETAVEILRLVDGRRALGAIADDLAARFAAPRPEILADVADLIVDFVARGALTL
jgi:pyrroloquinoline quinone biosynthesis protein D